MTTQTTSKGKAEQRFAKAIAALEAFFAQHGNCGSPMEQQRLEREYRRARLAFRDERRAR